MIKFFRQIRQSLLSEGKTRKYLLYAIGEILLVVVGILIALQVNNWNETRKEFKTENEFISSVRNDLNQDKEFIKLIIEQIEPRIEAFEVLNSDLPDLYQHDKNRLNSVFNLYFKSQRTFYPLSGSYESAVSGNQLTAFRNRDWVEKVVRLYNSTYDRLIDNGRMLDDRWAFIS